MVGEGMCVREVATSVWVGGSMRHLHNGVLFSARRGRQDRRAFFFLFIYVSCCRCCRCQIRLVYVLESCGVWQSRVHEDACLRSHPLPVIDYRLVTLLSLCLTRRGVPGLCFSNCSLPRVQYRKHMTASSRRHQRPLLQVCITLK